jgi:hypothetical protein
VDHCTQTLLDWSRRFLHILFTAALFIACGVYFSILLFALLRYNKFFASITGVGSWRMHSYLSTWYPHFCASCYYLVSLILCEMANLTIILHDGMGHMSIGEKRVRDREALTIPKPSKLDVARAMMG